MADAPKRDRLYEECETILARSYSTVKISDEEQSTLCIVGVRQSVTDYLSVHLHPASKLLGGIMVVGNEEESRKNDVLAQVADYNNIDFLELRTTDYFFKHNYYIDEMAKKISEIILIHPDKPVVVSFSGLDDIFCVDDESKVKVLSNHKQKIKRDFSRNFSQLLADMRFNNPNFLFTATVDDSIKLPVAFDEIDVFPKEVSINLPNKRQRRDIIYQLLIDLPKDIFGDENDMIVDFSDSDHGIELMVEDFRKCDYGEIKQTIKDGLGKLAIKVAREDPGKISTFDIYWQAFGIV